MRMYFTQVVIFKIWIRNLTDNELLLVFTLMTCETKTLLSFHNEEIINSLQGGQEGYYWSYYFSKNAKNLTIVLFYGCILK